MKRPELAEVCLAAARADCIPVGDNGLWYVRKVQSTERVRAMWRAQCGTEPPPIGRYTVLLRWTDSTLHLGHGETVMSDEPGELRKHLAFMTRARGRVLVTGLGLGCVLRGLQVNPAVKRITLVELERDVIDLVWPYMPHFKTELIHADALRFLQMTDRRWDCAWHDVWTDTDNGDPELQVQHARMMVHAYHRVGWQGAWAFPRRFKPRRISERRIACQG